uniref:Putative serine esterase domain containing protein n=1 Tax=Babesia bovis TaxID=5865 RepID=S6B0U9_BABBO|nr:putative serine esterase domain containing protein [Babesia bovis]
MSVASPHAGIYENNAAFRKIVGLVGSKTVDELDNDSVDLLFLASRESMDGMKKFKNVVVYGNLSGDFLVAPRTSLLMPRHRVAGKMVKSFIKYAEKDTGEPHSIWDMLSKCDVTQVGSDDESDSDVESSGSFDKDCIMAKLMESFYATVASLIKKTQHLAMFTGKPYEPVNGESNEDLCKRCFTFDDLEFFKMLFSQIEDKSSKKLLSRLAASPKLLYNEVLLTALWDMAPNKYAVYLPTLSLPHRSILTPLEGSLWHKYTNKVLPQIASIFIT